MPSSPPHQDPDRPADRVQELHARHSSASGGFRSADRIAGLTGGPAGHFGDIHKLLFRPIRPGRPMTVMSQLRARSHAGYEIEASTSMQTRSPRLVADGILSAAGKTFRPLAGALCGSSADPIRERVLGGRKPYLGISAGWQRRCPTSPQKTTTDMPIFQAASLNAIDWCISG